MVHAPNHRPHLGSTLPQLHHGLSSIGLSQALHPTGSSLVHRPYGLTSDVWVSGYASTLHPAGSSFHLVVPLSSLQQALPQAAEPHSPRSCGSFLHPCAFFATMLVTIIIIKTNKADEKWSLLHWLKTNMYDKILLCMLVVLIGMIL